MRVGARAGHAFTIADGSVEDQELRRHLVGTSPVPHPHRWSRSGPGYIDQLTSDILDGTVQPGRVFDRTAGLDEAPDGYRAMNDRTALKVLIRP